MCPFQDLLDENPCLTAYPPFVLDVIIAEALCTASQNLTPVNPGLGGWHNPDVGGGVPIWNPDVGGPIENPDVG